MDADEEHERDKVATLEKQIVTLREEFNSQRAKLKELYISKENECQELRKELNTIRESVSADQSNPDTRAVIEELQLENKRANEEILSLQALINETVDESTNTLARLQILEEHHSRLKHEYNVLKESSQDTNILGPAINQVKTIVRKLGTSDSSSHENMDDSMKKAQEEADYIRSIVMPLEEEIKELKDKLHVTTAEIEALQLEKSTIQALAAPKTPIVKSASTTFNCEMCENYETQLVQCQESLSKTSVKTDSLEKSVADLQAELEKEIALRKELDKQWQEKRDQNKQQVESLTEQVKKTEGLFQQLIATYNDMKEKTNMELLRVSAERERLDNHLEMLQKDNDFLSGKYISHSEELKEREINLPQSVGELHELVLKLHEDLIIAKSTTELAEVKYLTFQDEANLLRDQLFAREEEKQIMEGELKNKIHSIEQHLKQQEDINRGLLHEKGQLEMKEKESMKQISSAQLQIMEISEAKEKFEKLSQDLRGKVVVLQQELANNEAVQKDFVKLSQSLQMQLEKIRSENTQVRWQDEDEAENCNQCKRDFTVTRRKHHCRHCGTIFCDSCLTKTVNSRSGRKQARVCDICHTLLVSTSAPYFSENINL